MTASREMVFNIFATLAQFDRRLIQERMQVGLKAARQEQKKRTAKKISPDDPKVKMAKKLSKNLWISIREICNPLKISRAKYSWYLLILV